MAHVGRKRILTEEVVAEAHRLRRAGKTRAQIASALGISNGSAGNALREPPAVEGDRPSRPREPRVERELGAELQALGLAEQRALLSEHLRRLEADANAARADGDMASALQATRLSGALVTALRHITEPEPPPDPNDRPDMREAADSGRKKLGEYGERARLGKSYGPARVGPSSGS